MSSCQLPLSSPAGEHNPQCIAGTFLCIVLHGRYWSCLFLPCWGVAGEQRSGQDCSSQLWCIPRTEKQRNPIQPGSRQHWLVSSNTQLLPSQQNRIALCLQSRYVCVCACMPGCMEISFPKAPCPLWVCFGGVPLHKYWKSPVELFILFLSIANIWWHSFHTSQFSTDDFYIISCWL